MKYSLNELSDYYRLTEKCFCGSSKPQKYIHYTSQESFYQMFKNYIERIDLNSESEEPLYINIFASQIQYLNDKQEYKEGLLVISDEKVSADNLTDSIFVVCFCGKEDLLSQWKYYGKNCGIAIEFDFDEETVLCWYSKDGEEKILDTKYWIVNKPHKVFYDEHKENFNKIFKVIKNAGRKDETVKEAANIFIPYCKNSAFEEEDESRMVFYPVQSQLHDAGNLITKIDFRVTNGKIVPQFKCKVAYGNKTGCSIPIKSIMVGPGHNQRIVFNAIISMLESNKTKVKFYSDEIIDKIVAGEPNVDKELILKNNRVTYTTSDNIIISMSNIPFRD